MSIVLSGSGDPTAITVGESSMPRYGINSGAVTITSGRLQLTYFTAAKTESISQLSTFTGNTAAAATPTLCRMGVYSIDSSGAGTLIASVANDTTLFAATFATYTRSLSASFTKRAGARYAVGLLVVSGAATPTFYGNAQVPGTASFPGGSMTAPKLAAGLTGQTDLPASFTDASLVGNVSPTLQVLLP